MIQYTHKSSTVLENTNHEIIEIIEKDWKHYCDILPGKVIF